MRKDLIKMVMDKLGLAINEEFYINGFNRSEVFRFTEDRLEVKNFYLDEENWCKSNMSLNVIFESEITKVPFKPKYGDRYWSYATPMFNIVESVWTGNVRDFAFLKCECIFRTKEEADKNRPELYKKLTGKEILHV